MWVNSLRNFKLTYKDGCVVTFLSLVQSLSPPFGLGSVGFQFMLAASTNLYISAWASLKLMP